MPPLGSYWYKYKPVSSFGFNSEEDPDVQCQKMLRLTNRNGKWKDLRARIISLAHSKLVKSDMGCNQDDKIHTIIQMISEEFVDLFPEDEESSKRRHYIRQWILKMHRIRRRNMRDQHKVLKQSTKTELIDLTDNKKNFDLKTRSTRDPNGPTLNIPETRSLEPSPLATSPYFGQGSVIEPGTSKEKLPGPSKPLARIVNTSLAKTSANLLSLRMGLTNKQPIHQNVDDDRLMEVVARSSARSDELNARSSDEVETFARTSIIPYPQSPVIPSPSTSLAITKPPFRKFKPAVGSRTYAGGPSSSPSQSIQRLLNTGNGSESTTATIVTEQDSYLINFLKACNPPMDHYYDCFIKAGCRNYGYLFALSTWPKETRQSFLSSLGAVEGGSQGGSKPTDMDVLVMNRFLEVVFGLVD